MTNISIDEIRKIRELTGAGITDAKKALVEAGGDFDKALKAMEEKGFAKAEKRADKDAQAGLIATYTHDGRIGVVVEVNCETDFVAKTDEFKELVKDICLHIAASSPTDIKELGEQEFVKEPDLMVKDLIKKYIAKLGENIVVRRFKRFELGETGE